jgi:hypothetical protein
MHHPIILMTDPNYKDLQIRRHLVSLGMIASYHVGLILMVRVCIRVTVFTRKITSGITF